MNYRNGLVMNFRVSELISKLTENRERHLQIITEAKKNYLVALKKELEGKIQSLDEGKQINPNSRLPVPGDNLDEYDTAISMLKMTADETVELEQSQYHCYVLDKWEWQRNFLEVAATYSSTANGYLNSPPAGGGHW